MKALILYVVFVVIGAAIATGLGYLTEIEFSSTASLIVFLALFFSNFVVSWIAVILVMDGSFQDAQGRQAQIEIERAARASMQARERS
jgi:type III secretory pathway component EscU